jgi:S-DNA-T family DNA segregation ATPase FtsK/SpoIIIE
METETCIIRLAQMGHKVGIHLILSTSRPSVNVFTSLLRSNINSRIAFNTPSKTDSQTIIDMVGAEKLLGKGDMLFTTAELSKPKRLQGAFISEEEKESIIEYLKNMKRKYPNNKRMSSLEREKMHKALIENLNRNALNS